MNKPHHNPLVSVIVPAYNSEKFIAEALDTVFSQNYDPIQAIVVDDGSVDRTADIARQYDRLKYLYQENQGHAGAKNTGIAAADGTFIAFLDADDTWHPDKLTAQMEHLLGDPKIGYVISRMKVLLEPGIEWPQYLNREHYIADPPCYLPSALLVRRAVLDRVGIFDSRYKYSDDGDWFLRARDAAIPMAIVPRVLVYKRIHASNQVHDKLTTAETFAAVRASVERRRKSTAEIQPGDTKERPS